MSDQVASVGLTGALSLQDFCAKYAVGMSKLYQLLDAGEIKAKKIGTKKTVIPVSEAERWLASQPDYSAETKFAA